MEHYRKSGSGVLVLCGGETRARNLLRILEERGIPAVLDLEGRAMPAPGEVRLTLGALSAGSEWPSLNLAILTEGQLLSVQRKRPARAPKESNRQKLQSYTDLKPGDLVVHVHHGIGRFAGIHRLPTDGVEKDYIKLDYAGGDCLYVPVTQLDMVSKYIGGGEDAQEKTRLNKLGGTEWTKQRSRAKAAVKDLAKGLIQLYAQRSRQPGFAFSPDSAWQQEFEDAFPYQETEDQLRAIREIKADMEKPRPMDRLLCGDVGYGKTEVALRAVMKCILDGKQAAILVPTTVLAQQHYATAQSRFRSFPVTIEVLSRFTTPKEQKRILSNLAEGRVDLIIGTHKLIQKSVKFHDLGLLVIDEEQRFGVSPQGKAPGDGPPGGHPDPLRDPHPPDPQYVPLGPAGYVHPGGAAPGPPGRSRPTFWRRTGASWRTPAAGSWTGAARSTSSTTGWRASTGWPPGSRSSWAPRPASPWATARWGSRSFPPSCSRWWRARRTSWSAPPSSRPASTSPT